MHFVYFLQSVKHNRLYIGVTTDPGKRLVEHNKGSSRSTKPYRPWKLVYTESYKSKGDAYKREYFLKRPEGYKEKLRIRQSLKFGEVA